MQKIFAYILTFNEAEKIKAAVESVLWADEVVVADSNSTDLRRRRSPRSSAGFGYMLLGCDAIMR